MEKAKLKDLDLITVSDMVDSILSDMEKAQLMVGDIVQDYLNYDGKGDENDKRAMLEHFRGQYATRGAIAEEYLHTAMETAEILQLNVSQRLKEHREKLATEKETEK